MGRGPGNDKGWKSRAEKTRDEFFVGARTGVSRVPLMPWPRHTFSGQANRRRSPAGLALFPHYWRACYKPIRAWELQHQ